MKRPTFFIRSMIALLITYAAYDSLTISKMILGYSQSGVSSLPFVRAHVLDFTKVMAWRYSFFIHAFIGIVVLSSGIASVITSFVPSLKSVHRFFGKIYLLSVLLLSAPAALVMSFFARGLWITKVNFFCLGLAWFWVTFRGYQLIRERRFRDHAIVMILSYGLTCAALLQRRITFWGTVLNFIFLDRGPAKYLYEVSAVGGWAVSLSIALVIVWKCYGLRPSDAFRLLFKYSNNSLSFPRTKI